MTRFVEARMHLGVEITGAGRHPGAAAWTGQDPAGPRQVLAQVGTAAGRGLDLVALGGSDAVALATRVAPAVGGIGLVPGVPLGDAAVAADALAGLDVVSAGRAGWEATGPVSDDAIAAVVEHWNAWGVGGGPAISPRSPQGRPPLVLRADDEDALPVVARWADVVRIGVADLVSARDLRLRVRAAVADAGRDPETVPVLLDVEVHLASDAHRARADVAEMDALADAPAPSTVRVLGGAAAVADLMGGALRLDAVDGVTLVPLVLPVDLRRVTEDLVPLLAWRGLFRPGRSGTLRSRLGLAQPLAPARRASA